MRLKSLLTIFQKKTDIALNKKTASVVGSGYSAGYAPAIKKTFTGDKFAGGFGLTELLTIDYWTLRQRSTQLFETNLYAKGIIRRLLTNEINTGLTPDVCPDEEILGLPADSLNDWGDDVEKRFAIWASNPQACDFYERSTFGELQYMARMEALISGDVLIILRQSNTTGLPQVELVNANCVRTPFGANTNPSVGNIITHGVEINNKGHHVAFWIDRKGTKPTRISAYGAKTKRKVAWLLYGADKRVDDVRGQPILSAVIQSLREIDRYRDSAQRQAVVNSMLAMFVKKTEDAPSSLALSSGAVRQDSVELATPAGDSREFLINESLPGIVIETLQTGEDIVQVGGSGTDINFPDFEAAMISGIAWHVEMPPEIAKLSFSSNYSASGAAINEFKIYVNKVWGRVADGLCRNIYVDWLISKILLGDIVAEGLVQAWGDPRALDFFGAWTASDWYGSIKVATDMRKQGQASQILVAEGWSTNARESRVTTGTKFTKNIKRLKRENELKMEALRPLAEFKQEFGEFPNIASNSATDDEDIVN